ncbi:hypothetical protein V6R21_20385 [Limibacter armeniacum]|uniref:hypothetical protein n=1 Tax=Limibacter armeniacum TaxID=466084 RepID=UPI002FE5A292
MEQETLHLKLENTGNEVIIRHGVALPLKEPKTVVITGSIYAPQQWMESQKELLNKDECHLKIDRLNAAITLVTNHHNAYHDTVKGELKRAEILDAFGINTGKVYTDKELAKFFRKTRFYFVSQEEANKTIRSLEQFKARIESDIENEQDKRGNARLLFERRVQSDVPEMITLRLPVFQGLEAEELSVMICAECTSHSVEFSLESMDLYQKEEERKDEIFDAIVEEFDNEFKCAIISLS